MNQKFHERRLPSGNGGSGICQAKQFLDSWFLGALHKRGQQTLCHAGLRNSASFCRMIRQLARQRLQTPSYTGRPRQQLRGPIERLRQPVGANSFVAADFRPVKTLRSK